MQIFPLAILKFMEQLLGASRLRGQNFRTAVAFKRNLAFPSEAVAGRSSDDRTAVASSQFSQSLTSSGVRVALDLRARSRTTSEPIMAKFFCALALFFLFAFVFSIFSTNSADAAYLVSHTPTLHGTVAAVGLMLPGLPRSRGIFTVRANADIATSIAGVNAAFDKFKSKYDGKLDDLQASVDQMNIQAAASRAGAGHEDKAPTDPEYTRIFSSWTRAGHDEADLRRLNAEGLRANIQASMNTGNDAAGGYLAPIEWDRQVLTALREVSPLRRIAQVVTTTVRAYTTVWNNKTWGSGWVGETAARPETATPQLSSIPFGHGEIYANPAVTQQLLDDADFNIANWLGTELADEFSRQEGPAFIAGDGVNKPFGFLTYVTGGANENKHPGGAIKMKTLAFATAISQDELLDLVYELASPYRNGAVWLMNSSTAGKIMKLKDGDGNFIWQRNLAAGQPSTLLGYPVEIDENMPNMVADAIPVAFGDFKRGYVINDRTGVRVLRDPYTNKPYVHFYTTKRVGGGVRDPNAIRVMKMAAA